MRALPAHVVGLWATMNTALALGIIAYSGDLFPILVHVGGSALVAGFGLAVLLAWRRHAVGPQLRVAYRSVAALATGVFALVMAGTAVYGLWVLVLAPYPALVAVVMAFRERLPTVAAGVTRPQKLPVDRPPTPQEVRAEALEVAHARTRRRRGEAT